MSNIANPVKNILHITDLGYKTRCDVATNWTIWKLATGSNTTKQPPLRNAQYITLRVRVLGLGIGFWVRVLGIGLRVFGLGLRLRVRYMGV